MLRRCVVALVVLLAAVVPPSSAHAGGPNAPIKTRPVRFIVEHGLPGETVKVAGTMYRPSGKKCQSVLLLVHGLSYGQYAWDFPIGGERYSTARALAHAGYAVVNIDLPGYGRSDKPDGYFLIVFAYADMINQILGQLYTGAYGGPKFAHTGLVSHSAGTEISEVAATFDSDQRNPHPIDVLVATGYTHFPSPEVVRDFFTGDYVRAAMDDYEYFCETPAGRLRCFYHRSNADPKVMRLDNKLANLTPSGEIYSIGPQPSKALMASITAPVLLVLAEYDYIFPSANGEQEMLLFAGSSDKKLYVAPDVGHSFMLHRSAPRTNAVIVRWLRRHSSALPACA